MKLEQILEQQKHFLQDYERRGKSKNSLKCYRLDFTIFNAFLALMQKHETAQNNIDHFNAGFLESFDSYLRQKYKNLNSVNRKLQTLRLYYDFLKNKGLCDHNPMAKLKPSAKVLYPPTFHPQTHMEYIQTYLIGLMRNTSSPLEQLIQMRNYLAFIFVSQAGLSVSQLTLLKKQDVLVSSGGDMRILIAQHRKRDPYTIPMEHSFALTYSHYLELLKQEQQTSSYFFDELFFHANQKKILNSGLTQRSFEHIFKAISEVLKIEFTLKSLRQTCILRWVGNGVSLASIKEWLGVAPAYDISPFTHFVDSQLELCQSLKPLHELPIR